MINSLQFGGRVVFEGKLDVAIANRVLSKRDIRDIYKAHEAGVVPFVVLQVDGSDVVQNYFLRGKWIKPKESKQIPEAIESIARYLGIEITMSKLVLDCLKLGH